MEGKIEEIKDGRLLMVMRTQLGSVFKSISDDGGVTWSKAQTSGLIAPESCPGLKRIPHTGDLLLIWNNSLFDPWFDHSGVRSPLTIAISRDDGLTWEKIKNIETDPEWEFTNPAAIVTRNGEILVAYEASKYESLTGPGHGNSRQTTGRVGRDRMHLKLAVMDLNWLYE
jgi:sialidase-1